MSSLLSRESSKCAIIGLSRRSAIAIIAPHFLRFGFFWFVSPILLSSGTASLEEVLEQAAGICLSVSVARTAHAYRMMLLMIVLRPLGNLSLAWGMRHTASILSVSAYTALKVVANPFVIGGIALLVLTLLIRMATLSLADLSLVLPLTALGYILSTALGRFVLGEAVSQTQWLGTVFIFLGASLVTSEHHTTSTISQTNCDEE